MYNPDSSRSCSTPCRSGSYKLFKEYTRVVNDESQRLARSAGF